MRGSTWEAVRAGSVVFSPRVGSPVSRCGRSADGCGAAGVDREWKGGRGRAYNIHVVKRVSRDRMLQRGTAIW